MRRLPALFCGIVAAGVIVASVGATSSAAGRSSGGNATALEPVPSLTPAATQRLWSELVQRPRLRALRSADCRPLRAVFYAATDWLRLATKLAANASSCAQYYISVPPLAADKTHAAFGSGVADPRARAQRSTRWPRSTSPVELMGRDTGNSWYAAGVEARRRMAAAGYDVAPATVGR